MKSEGEVITTDGEPPAGAVVGGVGDGAAGTEGEAGAVAAGCAGVIVVIGVTAGGEPVCVGVDEGAAAGPVQAAREIISEPKMRLTNNLFRQTVFFLILSLS
jgi:hypothetical protein